MAYALTTQRRSTAVPIPEMHRFPSFPATQGASPACLRRAIPRLRWLTSISTSLAASASGSATAASLAPSGSGSGSLAAA